MMIENRDVLVTGGAGFVGSHVTRELVRNGATVDVVDNLFAGDRNHVPDDATLHEIDIRNRDELVNVVREIDPEIIIHLAALHYIPYCNEHPEEAFDVNVMGTRHLLNAARELDSLERLVYTSTAAVYPPRNDPHAEQDITGPMDIYGRTKLVGEDLLEQFTMQTGVSGASIRLFNVYGSNETNPHLIPAILEQIEDGSRDVELGNLSPKRDFVYAEDVAAAVLTLATDFDDDYRVYNVGTGQAWSVREVAEEVGAALGEELTVEQAQERVRESDRPYLCADISCIEAETEWRPETAFVDGLQTLLDAEEIE